jgi:hypothetical protein
MMRVFGGCVLGAVATFITAPALASVIMVSPADGTTGYTKIEGAKPGDEVVIAPGTYTYRVYLTQTASAAQPIYIHAQDPANPPVWDFGKTLVENAPGSYTAPDKNRGCWQVSGASNITIESIVFRGCTAGDYDSAGLRYYGGTKALVIRNCLFQNNDNGLTGGTEASEAGIENCEFASNGNTNANPNSPTHNVYIYGGTFTMRYSYLHDPTQGQNLHCRAVTSTIEYSWFDRAKSYVGDLMTSDDYANSLVGSDSQTMTLLGNVIIESPNQANTGQIIAMYNDAAMGHPVTLTVNALYNTVIGAGGHANFIHLSNADGTQMKVYAANNIIFGTSQPFFINSMANGTLSGTNNWVETGASTAGLTASIVGASPGFTNAAMDDFTLAAGSPCIGAASASVMPLPMDEYFQNETVTRMSRVRAAAMDLGAFEHDTTGPGVGPGGSDGGVVVVGADGGTAGTSSGGTAGSTSAGTTSGGTTSGVATSSSGGGTTTGGGADAGSASGGDGGAQPAGEKSGCGCVVAGASERGGALLGVGVGAVAIARGRRRRRD